ncbi:hypothetical protein GCM10009078_34060 [Cupriavidus gilardii]
MTVNRLYAGYQAELADFRLAFSRGGAYTAIVLVLLGMGLDYGQYPEWQVPFAVARIVVSMLIAGIVVVLYSQHGRRLAPWLTLSWLLLPQLMIAWMIWETDGVASPYYVGLNLAIFAGHRAAVRPVAERGVRRAVLPVLPGRLPAAS